MPINTTWSTVRGYSPHYLMFGCRLRLPIDFYFPTLRSTEEPRRGTSTKCVNEYVATVRHHLKTTLQEAQAQSMAEDQRQKWCYNWKIGTIGLKPGNLILVKADNFQGKRKIKDRWEDKPHEIVCQIATDIPLNEVKTSMEIHMSYIATGSSLHQKLAFPCAWVSTNHKADVPVPPQSSLLLEGMTVRKCHKKMMVWQSPSIRLGRLPLGG